MVPMSVVFLSIMIPLLYVFRFGSIRCAFDDFFKCDEPCIWDCEFALVVQYNKYLQYLYDLPFPLQYGKTRTLGR